MTRMTAIEMLEKLVAFDTTSRNSNLGMIAFIEDWLAAHGIAARRVMFGPDKANLVAVIGPEDTAGGYVLSGHTDVVPVDGQEWSSDPFSLRMEDGRAYGRGTADMKGFLACVLALAPEMARRQLKRPIILAFSCDEEVGCTGVRPMIDWMRANLPPVAAVFIGEPTGMEVVAAHKGIAQMRTEVTGHEAHGSCPQLGVNAISYTGEVVAEINRMAREEEAQADPASGFVPPYSTINIGRIAGGTAGNIIAGHCRIEWEVRLMPDTAPEPFAERLNAFARENLEPEMRRVSDKAGIETEVVHTVPGLRREDDSAAVRLALRFAEANGVAAVSFGTEAGLFQQAGMPAVVCGPGHIDQAHKPDEYVELSQLDACTAFLRRLIDDCA
ncbi:MAG TPA: acetylornithine deacetylase [Thermopetrobacter sp.]|nr:acetylornithine deacetylase [Thermopetrobacter sp.]